MLPLLVSRFFLICLLVTTCVAARAQIQFIASTYPENGATNVSTDVVISLRSTTVISPTSMGEEGSLGALVLVDDATAASVSPEKLSRMALPGSYRIVEGKELRFTPRHLQPSTTYRCFVVGLALYDGIDAEPRVVPAFEIVFRTADDIPRLLHCSLLGAEAIRCGDPISLQFSQSILPFRHRWNSMFMAEERSGTTHADARFALDVDEGGKVARLVPIGMWTPGSSVRVRCVLSAITGDSMHNRAWTIPVRNATHVVIDARSADGRALPQEILDDVAQENNSLTVGDSIPLHAPTWLPDRWKFVRWFAPSVPSVHGSTQHDVLVYSACNVMESETRCTAILERLDADTLRIHVDSGGVVHVLDSAFQDIGRLFTDTTIILNDRTPVVHCLAVPNAAFALAATSSVFNTYTPNAAVGPKSFTPVFNPLNPNPPITPVPELYRLRGIIENADADQRTVGPQDAFFTTESYFEDTQKRDGTLCVRTQGCWEIAGYVITGTNKSYFFDVPQRELCISAPLLDPINTVIFYVQRKSLQLRVENVLIHGDDPNAILPGAATHPDVKIEAYKLIPGSSPEAWQRISTLRCFDNAEQRHFLGVGVQCGDRIQLRIKDAPVRGQVWKFFAPVVRYVVPSGGSLVGGWRVYELDIASELAQFRQTLCAGGIGELQEIRCRACFGQTFGIESIALRIKIRTIDRKDDLFEEHWFDPLFYYERLPQEPIGGRQLEYVTRQGTIIKVRFNAPLDLNSLRGGGMVARSEDNIEPSFPQMTGLDFTVASTAGNTSYYPQTGGPITTAEFRINDPASTPRLQALPFGNILLTCTTGLTSLAGEPLVADASYVLNTMEIPGLGVILDKVELAWDGDNDFLFFENNGEIYHVSYGGIFGLDKIHGTDVAMQRQPNCSAQQGTTTGECTYSQSDKDAPMNMGEHLLLIEPHGMDLQDIVGLHIESWDEDCKDQGDCFVNRVNDLLDYVTEQAELKGTESSESGSSFGFTDLVALGAKFIKVLLPPDEQDQPLGEANLTADLNTLWSAIKEGNGRYALHGQYVTYHMRSLLYPRKRVVR